QTRGQRLRGAEFEEPWLAANAIVRKIGREIVKSLRRALGRIESDANPGSQPFPLFVRRALTRLTARIQRNEADVSDRFSGARKKHVKDRQRSLELFVLQVRPHVLGDEEGKAEDAVEGFLEVLQNRIECRSPEMRQIGKWADRFGACENISPGIREKLVGVKKIRPAKHVVDDRQRLG